MAERFLVGDSSLIHDRDSSTDPFHKELLRVGDTRIKTKPKQDSNFDVSIPGPLGDTSLGSANAPNVIIEYGSLTCGHCANWEQETFPKLEPLIDEGKVRLIFRAMPYDELGLKAAALAQSLRAVVPAPDLGDPEKMPPDEVPQDRYYPFIHALLTREKEWAFTPDNQPATSDEGLRKIAKEFGIDDPDKIFNDQFMQEKLMQVRVTAEEDFPRADLVRGTPTFFINGKIHEGELSIDAIKKQLKR